MIDEAGTEDDGDFSDMVEGLTMNDAIHPSPGGAFSALTPSMWPQDILARLTQPEVKICFFHLLSSCGQKPMEVVCFSIKYFSRKIQTISQTIDSTSLASELKKRMDRNPARISC